MKEVNEDLKGFALAAGLLLALGVLAFFLSSCQKNVKYDWACNGEIILSIPGCSAIPDSIPAKTIYLYDKTFAEAWNWECNKNYNITIVEGNIPLNMESRFHCLPTVCPEY
jgi:hypothetical protein